MTDGRGDLDSDEVTLAAPISSASSRAITVSSAPPLLVRLLGPLAIEGPRGVLSASDLRPKEQRVLARLALSPGEVVLRDELLDLFWHQSPVASAERSLRTVVSSLRGSLRRLLDGPSTRLITGRGDGYQLEAPVCAVDADLFGRAIREASSSADAERTRSCWQRAEELYRGDLLLAFQYEDWCLTARERLRSQFLGLLFELAGHAMAQRRYRAGLSTRAADGGDRSDRRARPPAADALLRVPRSAGRGAAAIRALPHGALGGARRSARSADARLASGNSRRRDDLC